MAVNTCPTKLFTVSKSMSDLSATTILTYSDLINPLSH